MIRTRRKTPSPSQPSADSSHVEERQVTDPSQAQLGNAAVQEGLPVIGPEEELGAWAGLLGGDASEETTEQQAGDKKPKRRKMRLGQLDGAAVTSVGL